MTRQERIEQMKYLRFEKKWTLQQIGNHFGGLSRERVRQLIGNTGYVAWDAKRQQKSESEKMAA
jgi:hypothetical protein